MCWINVLYCVKFIMAGKAFLFDNNYVNCPLCCFQLQAIFGIFITLCSNWLLRGLHIYWNTAARFRFLLQNWKFAACFLDISLRRPSLLRNNFTSRRPFLAWISLFGSQLIHNNSQSSVTKALGELLIFILSTHLVVILKSVFILEQATGDSTGIRRFWKENQFKFWQKILWLRWLKSIPGN